MWKAAAIDRVYPRVCGGTLFTAKKARQFRGLSPRVRGNLEWCEYTGVNERSIPACAGEPIMLGWIQRRWWVYPRVCGGTPASHHVQ